MSTERRNSVRANLQVPVFLAEPGSTVPIRALTEDVSKDGFFAYTPRLFSPGDSVKFVLVLPAVGRTGQPHTGMCVYGEAQVVRAIIDTVNTQYGIGCRFTNYRTLADTELLEPEGLLATILTEDFHMQPLSISCQAE